METGYTTLFIAAVLVLLLVALILVLRNAGSKDQETKTPPRFTYEELDEYCIIITDNQTGVQYLYYDGYYAGGLTKLEDGTCEKNK